MRHIKESSNGRVVAGRRPVVSYGAAMRVDAERRIRRELAATAKTLGLRPLTEFEVYIKLRAAGLR